jgi:hypothetical protein
MLAAFSHNASSVLLIPVETEFYEIPWNSMKFHQHQFHGIPCHGKFLGFSWNSMEFFINI